MTARGGAGGKHSSRGGRTSLWLAARHDFRQPVQAIELLAGSLREARSAVERQRIAFLMTEIAASLRDMVEGLTLVARLETGNATPVLSAVPLAGAVEQACDAIGPAAADVETAGVNGKALTDPAVLEAALRGAIVYALRQRAAGRVQVGSRARRGGIEIAVSFEGVHPSAAREDGAMAFVELPPHGPGATATTGLAPSLAARLLQAIGGRLVLEGPVAGEARVVLRLPVAAKA